MPLQDFQILAKIGKGAYSSVYTVKRISDGQQYALKQVKILNLSDKEKTNALTQIRILASMNSQNIVKYKEAFIENNCLYLVMEYMNNGDLFQKIEQHQRTGTYFKQEIIWKYLFQIAKGLRSLHKANVLHRDLKSANVFLGKNDIAKLGDLNVSKIANQGMCVTQTGTPYYASPEVWQDQPYNNKSDIWSLGCVIYEMAMLKPPFRAQDMQGLYKKVQKGLYPKLSNRYSPQLAMVIKKMLQVFPNKRPSCDQLLNLSFLKKYNKQNNPKSQSFPNLLKTIYLPKNIKLQTSPSIFPLATYRPPLESSTLLLPSLSSSHSPSKFSKPFPQTNKQKPLQLKNPKIKSIAEKYNKINYAVVVGLQVSKQKNRLPSMKIQKSTQALKRIYMS